MKLLLITLLFSLSSLYAECVQSHGYLDHFKLYKNAKYILAHDQIKLNYQSGDGTLLPMDKESIDCVDSTISSWGHKFYGGGFSFIVEATIDDTILDARVYFKNESSNTFAAYAKMHCTKGRCYTALPVSNPKLLVLEYIIVYKNLQNKLFTSRNYVSIKRDLIELPAWQKRHQKSEINLFTEYSKKPSYIPGFDITADLSSVNVSEIYGVKLGFYKLEDILSEKIDLNLYEQCQEINIGAF
jgi:hypothetical protein